MKLLTITIPTICSRLKEFTELHLSLTKQVEDNKLQDKIEIIHLRDNKEMSIGTKRQKLIEASKGKYCVQVDDDDRLADDYCVTMIEHMEKYPSINAFGYIEHINADPQTGQPTIAYHKNEYSDWWYSLGKYGRTLFFKDPILTEICKKVGVKDMRFGEDHQFARDLKNSELIRSSMFINKEMYFYRYKYEPHNAKYGIK